MVANTRATLPETGQEFNDATRLTAPRREHHRSTRLKHTISTLTFVTASSEFEGFPRMPTHGREPSSVPVGQVPILNASADQAIELCLGLICSGRGGKIATANLDFLAQARQNESLRSDLIASTLVVADGMPVVWLARIAGARRIARLAGVDLVREICARYAAPQPLRVAIFGSTNETASLGAEYLERHMANGLVARVITPPFRSLTAEELQAYREELIAAEPNLVLVALGCPNQERLIAEWFPSIPTAVWVGVGGTFDFFAGKRKRAPLWAQQMGLEWVVRLTQDPRHLYRRYLLRDLPALVFLVPSCLRSRFASR